MPLLSVINIKIRLNKCGILSFPMELFPISLEEPIRSLMENMKLSLNQAMDALNIPVEKQSMYADRILS